MTADLIRRIEAYQRGESQELTRILIDCIATLKAPAEGASVPVSVLASMFESESTDPNQPGHQWAKGWNAALRRAMDYARPNPRPHDSMRSRELRFCPAPDGRWIDDDDFNHDASLRIDGDFADNATRKQYADMICAKLNAEPVQAPAPAPDAEPLFLLHCGQIDSSGEQDEWGTEADSGRRVDEFCRLHPGKTVKLYPHVQAPAVAQRQPLTEVVALEWLGGILWNVGKSTILEAVRAVERAHSIVESKPPVQGSQS